MSAATVIAGRAAETCPGCGMLWSGVNFGHHLDGSYDTRCLMCTGKLHREQMSSESKAGDRRPLRWLAAPCTFTRRELDRLSIIGFARGWSAGMVQEWVRELNTLRLAGTHVVV